MAEGEFLKGHAKEKRSLYRLLTIFFGIDLLIIGLVTIIASAVIIEHYKKYLDFADTKYLGGIAFCLIVGIVVLIVGAVGIYASVNERVGGLQSFFILVIVLLFMAIIGGSLCLAYRSKVDNAVDNSLNRGITEYYVNVKTKDFFDWLHKEYKCCGLNGPGDWPGSNSSNVKGSTAIPPMTTLPPVKMNTTANATVKGEKTTSTATPKPTTSNNVVNFPAPNKGALKAGSNGAAAGGVPTSCCKEGSSSATCTQNSDNLYQKGCKKDFEDLIHYLLGVVGTIAFACAIIELIGACITYVFLTGVKENLYQTIS